MPSRISVTTPPPTPSSAPHPGPIVVIGSINIDLVCRTPRLPGAGETITGHDFQTIPGGKGANQAVAAARLGGRVYMVGRVGDDDFGGRLRAGLAAAGVDVTHVSVTPGVPSGCALIAVDGKGENSIVVVPGANARLTPADVDAAGGVIAGAAAVVLQLEVPLDTVRHAIALCQRMGVFTILDPAPVPEKGVPRAVLGVDVLTPNQIEAGLLLRTPGVRGRGTTKRFADPTQVAADLLAKGPRSVVMKLGGRGALAVDRTGAIVRAAGFKVEVVDTTAAGDAFTGALAVGRAEGKSLREAVRFANAAGALCCRAFGAQPALPTRGEVDAMLTR